MLEQWLKMYVENRPCVLCKGVPGKRGYLCDSCRERLEIQNQRIYQSFEYLDVLYSCGLYAGELRKLLTLYKFQEQRYLNRFFASLLLDLMAEQDLLSGGNILTYVPMTKGDFHLRGYNQCLDVCMRARPYLLHVEVKGILKKVRQTPPQVGLSELERRGNLVNAFEVAEVTSLEGKDILLFDDIYTTGATLEACARALKEAGAKKVTGLVIAG